MAAGNGMGAGRGGTAAPAAVATPAANPAAKASSSSSSTPMTPGPASAPVAGTFSFSRQSSAIGSRSESAYSSYASVADYFRFGHGENGDFLCGFFCQNRSNVKIRDYDLKDDLDFARRACSSQFLYSWPVRTDW